MGSRYRLSAFLMAAAWLAAPIGVSSRSVSSWYSSGMAGPQVLMYDIASGDILYSLCNSGETPIFPGNTTLQLKFPPINGTSVAGLGYLSGNTTTAVVHYQEQGGGIVQALFVCNSSTGFWEPNAGPAGYSWIVSDGVLPSIYNGTDLMALDLGADPTEGYRIYFKDAELMTAGLRYDQAGGWGYDGYVTQDNSSTTGIGAALTSATNIMVAVGLVGIDEEGELLNGIEFCTTNSNNSWSIDSIPYPIVGCTNDNCSKPFTITNQTSTENWVLNMTLPAPFQLDTFDANHTSLGVSFDSQGDASVFYIGTAKVLYQFEELDGVWQEAPQQDGRTKWPPADDSNADFSVAYDQITNRVWVYYVSNGSLIQAYRSDNTTWEDFTTLPVSASVAAAAGGSSSGLSHGAKVGLGVGLGLGIPILAAVIAFSFIRSMRRSREQRHADDAAAAAAATGGAAANPAGGDAPGPDVTQYGTPGSYVDYSRTVSPAPQYTSGYGNPVYGQWVQEGGDWTQKPEQMSIAMPIHEMPSDERAFEMGTPAVGSAMPAPLVAEMPNTSVGETMYPGTAPGSPANEASVQNIGTPHLGESYMEEVHTGSVPAS